MKVTFQFLGWRVAMVAGGAMDAVSALFALVLIKLHLLIPLAIVGLVAWLIWRTLSTEAGLAVALIGVGLILTKCT